MSEHVITVVDEETNKISSNLCLYSNISTYFYFSFQILAGVPDIYVCCAVVVDMMLLQKPTIEIRISWAANYIDSHCLQHVLILSLPVNNNGKK